jgi:hypothetical protein
MRYGDGVTHLYPYDAVNRLANVLWMLAASYFMSRFKSRESLDRKTT